MRWLLTAALIWLTAAPLAAQIITAAEYNEPTTRYPHGVLGDTEEWGNIKVTVRRERGKEGGLFHGWTEVTYDLRLPEEMVFEDLTPRLVDVDGVEGPEIVVVESHQQYGARLAVYGLNEEGVPALRAWSDFIGTRFRWLAPVGIADFDGDGVQDLAVVDRPHLARQLAVFRYQEGRLDFIGGMRNVTNHRIGDAYIEGGVKDCGDGPIMVMLDPQWVTIRLVKWIDGQFMRRDFGPYAGRESVVAALKCE